MEESNYSDTVPTLTQLQLQLQLQSLLRTGTGTRTGTANLDFHALLSLLSQVEHSLPNDIHAISLVYDKLLADFPLCYAYWIKYAMHKLRLSGPNDTLQVYERAVQALTFSVHLWSHYCTFAAHTFHDFSHVRRIFERALSFVGKDYLCHQIWDKYLDFEYTHKQWHQLASIYIKILKFPTKKLHVYYESFKKLVSLLEEEASIQGIELMSLSALCQNEERVKDLDISDTSSVLQGFMDSENYKVDIDVVTKYLRIGEELYNRSCETEKNIICYEDNITRHNFHMKPLDDSQLENWHQYLDFVETQGDFDWMVKLYERCLIPCAQYSEFWIRYINFVYEQGGKEIANYAFNRSTPFFQEVEWKLGLVWEKIPAHRMYCAMMKEELGDSSSARALLLRDACQFSSNCIKDIYREANFEKRKGNIDGAFKLYENEIESAVEKNNIEVASSLYINFAQFTFAATGCRDAAREVFVKGINQIPCKSLIKGLIQFEMIHGGASQIQTIDSIISNLMKSRTDGSSPLSYEDREEISMLFIDFIDLYGKTPQIRKAWARHCVLFPKESRNVFPNADSTTNKRAKMGENMDNCPSPNEISPRSNEAILGKEVNLQPNSEPTVKGEHEEKAKEGADSLDGSSDIITQRPELKSYSSVPAPDNNPNTNNDIDHSSSVARTDLARANSEPETVDHRPEKALKISALTVSPQASEMSEQVKMLIQSELDPHQSMTILGPNIIRPASQTQGEQSKSEMESDQDLHISSPNIALSNNLMQTSQPQENGDASSGQVCPSQMWQYNQHQLQQMYYYLQLQQQQLQQQVLQQNQSSSGLSSPDDSLQEKQQQLQHQMMYYQQTYQMYLQQSMQLQQQHWFQFQQQHLKLANAPSSQEKEQSGSLHPSTP